MPINKERSDPKPNVKLWLENELWKRSSLADKTLINGWYNNIPKFVLELEWLEKNEELMKKYIEDKYTKANTQRSHYRAYSNLIKASKNEELKKKWGKIWLESSKQISKEAGESKLSESRQENFVTEKELV